MDDPLTTLVLEIFQTHGTLIRFGDAFTKKHGLSSASWQVLGAIARGDGKRTVPQIARRMGQARQSVQRQTNTLVKRGFVVLQDNPDHKRSPYVALTEAGAHLQDQINEEWKAHIQPWRSRIGDHDFDHARDVIARLRALISPQ